MEPQESSSEESSSGNEMYEELGLNPYYKESYNDDDIVSSDYIESSDMLNYNNVLHYFPNVKLIPFEICYLNNDLDYEFEGYGDDLLVYHYKRFHSDLDDEAETNFRDSLANFSKSYIVNWNRFQAEFMFAIFDVPIIELIIDDLFIKYLIYKPEVFKENDRWLYCIDENFAQQCQKTIRENPKIDIKIPDNLKNNQTPEDFDWKVKSLTYYIATKGVELNLKDEFTKINRIWFYSLTKIYNQLDNIIQDYLNLIKFEDFYGPKHYLIRYFNKFIEKLIARAIKYDKIEILRVLNSSNLFDFNLPIKVKLLNVDDDDELFNLLKSNLLPPLTIAVMLNSVSVVNFLLETPKCNINYIYKGKTALYWAFKIHNYEMCMILLTKGANIHLGKSILIDFFIDDFFTKESKKQIPNDLLKLYFVYEQDRTITKNDIKNYIAKKLNLLKIGDENENFNLLKNVDFGLENENFDFETRDEIQLKSIIFEIFRENFPEAYQRYTEECKKLEKLINELFE